MDEDFERALNDAMSEQSEPPSDDVDTELEEEEPAAEATEEDVEPDSSEETGDKESEPEGVPTEPSIPYERFKEVNEAKIRAEEAARIYAEQLQRLSESAAEQVEYEEDDYDENDIPDDALEYESEAVKQLVLARRQERAELKELKSALNSIIEEKRRVELESKANTEFDSAVSRIRTITGDDLQQEDVATLRKNAEQLALNAINNNVEATVGEIVQLAYLHMMSDKKKTQIPPKDNTQSKIKAAPVGSGAVPSNARAVNTGDMDFDAAFKQSISKIGSPKY